MKRPPSGLWVELLTPLTRERELDRDGLERLVARAAPQAAALVLAGPVAGQGPLLSYESWRALVEAGLETAPPQTSLIIGLTAPESLQTLERAAWLGERLRRRQVWGLDLALYHHSNRGLPGWGDSLAAALKRPIILINHPEAVRRRKAPTSRLNLVPSVLAKCAARDWLAGLVFAGGLRQGLALQQALAPADKPLYDGDELAFLARPARAGVMSAGACLLPGPWRLVVEYARKALPPGPPGQGQRQALMEAARRVRDLAGLMANYPVSILAHLLHQAGLIASARCLAPEADASARRALSGQAETLLAAGLP